MRTGCLTSGLPLDLARVGLFALLLAGGAACGGRVDPKLTTGLTDGTRPAGATFAGSEASQAVGIHSLYTQVELPPDMSPALSDYLDGLDAMGEGRSREAVSAFSAALEIEGDEPRFVLARGVARTLDQEFDLAFQDLQRYQRLGGTGREAELWVYAVEAMTGAVLNDSHGMSTIRSLQQPGEPGATFSGIPGHVIQGGSDYPTDYASYVFYDMATPYGEQRAAGLLAGNDQVSAAMSAAMKEAGRRFADLKMTLPDLAPFHLTRARNLFESGQYRDAAVSAAMVRANFPGDSEAAYLAAQSWLELGRPATARGIFTIALTGRTDFGEAYLGRAISAARMGDGNRAKSDLEIAEKIDAESARRTRATVAAALDGNRVEGPAEMLLSGLEQSARSGAGMAMLIDQAVSVHRAMATPRLRYDEWYQDRLRTLEEAVRDRPTDPDRLVALAQHIAAESNLRGLFEESGPGLVGPVSASPGSYLQNYPAVADEINFRAERVEPGSPLRRYRWQESEARETGIALDYLDRAIALDSGQVRAMILKGFIADRKIQMILDSSNDQYLGKWRDGASLGASPDQVRSIASKDPDLEALSSWFFTQWSPAQGSSSSATSAETLDAVRDSYLGHLIQGFNHYIAGDPASAEESLKKARELDPERSDAHEQLVALFVLQGESEKALDALVTAVNTRYQTTAAIVLDLAADQISATAWQGAKQSLTEARALDPSDARTPAYLAEVHLGEDRLAEAEVAFRTAIALEEARLRLDDLSVVSGNPLTRDPQDYGLVMQLRLMLGNIYNDSSRPSEALEQYQTVTSYRPRFSPGWQSGQLFTAWLPDPAAPQNAQSSPTNTATLIAAAHFGAGQLLSTMGRSPEGLEEFRAAVALGPNPEIPNIGGAGSTNFAGHAQSPSGDALVELAKAAMTSGQYDLAQEYIQYVGYFSLSDAARFEANEIQVALGRELSQETEQLQDPFAGMDPEQRRMAEEQQRLEQDQIRQMIDQLPLDPSLIGVWEMKAQTSFVPDAILTIGADKRFSLVSQTDAVGRQGLIGVVGPQLMLLSDDGSIEVHTYQAATSDQLVLTSMDDGTGYDLTRRR